MGSTRMIGGGCWALLLLLAAAPSPARCGVLDSTPPALISNGKSLPPARRTPVPVPVPEPQLLVFAGCAGCVLLALGQRLRKWKSGL